MRKSIIILLIAVAMLLTACDVGTVPTASVTPSQSTTPTQDVGQGVTGETPSGKEYEYDENGNVIQKPDTRDYTTMWWRDGFNRGGMWQMNMQTGHYGVTVNTLSGIIKNLGYIKQEIPESQVNTGDNKLLESLPEIKTSYFAINKDGEDCKYQYTNAVGGGNISSRILESGRYMQRIDIMSLMFKNFADISGRVEIAVMPEYMALELALWSPDTKLEGVGMGIIFKLPAEYNVFTQSCDGRAITVANADGYGYSFIAPDEKGITYSIDGSNITFRYTGVTLKKSQFNGMGIIIIPSANASSQDAVNYIARERLQTQAVQISPKEGKEQDVTFDTHKGYLSIDMNKMMTDRTTDFRDTEKLDDLDRLKFTITNNCGADIKLPIQFVKEKDFHVEALSPMIRDAVTGEPVGVQVQLSKNWHEPSTDKNSPHYAARNDPKRYWSGTWFHGYTMIEIPAGKSVTYEMTIVYGTWGGVFACSHSQISLAGWGGNYQQWETSGIFGESFCYDPETAHGRSFIDDIRPLLVDSMGGKYGWTACNGGGNMLFYNKNKGGKIVYFKQVQTRFKKQGPNITEVIYTGVTLDDAVRFEITANLPRTDDASRVWHTFKYTFLKDVTFDRMAFYQFGADDYNDNEWKTMAVGNDDGTISFNIGDTVYSGEFACPTTKKAEYIGSDTMQRIEVPGEGMWFAFMQAVPLEHKSGPDANRMLNVVSYNATLNGKTYDKPSFNLRNTMNYNIPCIQVELCPPAEVGNKILKGSTVEGVVEYINLPVTKEQYYGPSQVMKGFPQEEFNTWKLAYRYAVGNKTTVTATVGKVLKQVPIYVETVDQDVMAEITVKGGVSYVPLTFTNVKSSKGFELQVKKGDTWEKVDQSVYGNDYWQTWYDNDTKAYEITYNVEHSGDKDATYSYRLVKVK